ncbi:MAG TPA: DUF2252 family protein [Tepidisphaeraceae bacterium]|nr:DUF2252 family protein [Tepidisphaeraceae bacterium]
MRRLFLIIALLIPTAGKLLAADAPYDVIQRSYAPYMSSDDPLDFAMKVRSLADDPYKFWRGSKDLFFIWCKSNTTDWLADQGAYLPNHGDLHLGNIGTYAAEGGWGKLAFGMVDFDDSAVLPFQIELLQGLITLELTARQNHLALDEAADQQLLKNLVDSYRTAVNSRRNANNLLLDEQDKTLAKMLKRASVSYERELDDWVVEDKFRSIVASEKGKLKDILRPAMQRADEFADGVAQAISNEPDFKKLMKFSSASQVRAAMKDAVQRTRLASSGSQGLKKYLILLQKPLHGWDHDAIIYLKQEIPSAAERSGVARSSLTPGQRLKQDMDRMTDPLPFINSWCEIGSESYWVSFKEPWSDELTPDDVKTFDDLVHMAHIWGTVAGATHREQGRFAIILPKLTATLTSEIQLRSKQFVTKLDADFDAFKADARVAEQVSRAQSAIESLSHR